MQPSNSFKWHNLKVKTIDKFFESISLIINFFCVRACSEKQIAREVISIINFEVCYYSNWHGLMSLSKQIIAPTLTIMDVDV